MALQVFRADQHPFEVTTVTVDQVPWFKGREVAARLGYVNPQQAPRKNVDEDDRKTYEELMEGVIAGSTPSKQQPHEVYINESGIYSLVLRSEKKEAKAFKRCVTSEVLPSIRRGCYVQHVIQPKVLCMAKPQQFKEEQRMLRAGKALSFEEAEQLNSMESIVQLSTWLESKVKTPTQESRRKLLHAFRQACKAARLQQAEDEDSLVPLVWNLGGHRIIYTMLDEEMLLDVLGKLRPKFEIMMRWYAGMAHQARKRKKQITMHAYVKKKNACSSGSSSSSSSAASSNDACADVHEATGPHRSDTDALCPTAK